MTLETKKTKTDFTYVSATTIRNATEKGKTCLLQEKTNMGIAIWSPECV